MVSQAGYSKNALGAHNVQILRNNGVAAAAKRPPMVLHRIAFEKIT
jgi:hypothetical protein